MAYMSQQTKSSIVTRCKPILKQYGIKGSFSVRNHSTIVLNITSGALDFIGNYIRTLDAKPHFTGDAWRPVDYLDVNQYHYRDQYNGDVLEFMIALFDALNLSGDKGANFDKSDIQSDYFHVGWYVDVNVGQYGKPYKLTSEQVASAA